ncbi:MAG: hypothetical protein DRR42_07150 [Gammaproteobacteria bacterium]|nr:MAG: hypothetical protein DRR42_07150 [Gammaproteobacteria bacterium]
MSQSADPASTDEEVVLTWNWDASEHHRANSAIFKARRLGVRLRFPLIALAIGISLGLFEVYFRDRNLLVGVVAVLFIPTFAFAGGVIGSRIQGRVAARQFSKKNPPDRRSMKVTITPHRYLIDAPDGSVSLMWRAIERVVESQPFFLLFTSSSGGYYIPKRAMDDQSQVNVRRFLKDMVTDCHLL